MPARPRRPACRARERHRFAGALRDAVARLAARDRRAAFRRRRAAEPRCSAPAAASCARSRRALTAGAGVDARRVALAARGGRAGPVHHRPRGVPRPRPRGGPPRAGAAPRDRGPGRGGARGAGGERDRWPAPARARPGHRLGRASRWRSRTSTPRPLVTATDAVGRRARRWRARTPKRCGLAARVTFARGRLVRRGRRRRALRGRSSRTRPTSRAAEAAGAAAPTCASGSRTRRCSPATTGSPTLREIVEDAPRHLRGRRAARARAGRDARARGRRLARGRARLAARSSCATTSPAARACCWRAASAARPSPRPSGAKKTEMPD